MQSTPYPQHYNWVPANGRTEEVFTGADGKRYQYMWNQMHPSTGMSEHAYYCLDDDLFLEARECSGRIWPRPHRST